ncbi:DUF4334 domain-containing protein [Tengunoibacter tsumagoiensis]
MKPTDVLKARAYQDHMSLQEALELCDTLPCVEIDFLIGRWRGSEISTGHALDGLLKTFGWYGKEFIDPDHVHPLLFSDDRGQIFVLDPRRLPLSIGLKWRFLRKKLVRRLLLIGRLLLQTRKAKARVRMVEYRGKVSASMIYDDLPIYDTFRCIDDNTLLGVMDYKGMEQPFFFKLHRDSEAEKSLSF